MTALIHTVIVYGSNLWMLKECLDTLYSQHADVCVTVVNNTLSAVPTLFLDEQNSRFTSFRWIDNAAPQGYSANNNLAIRQTAAGTPYILLLNDDVHLMDNALRTMTDVMNACECVGAVGPRILNRDLSLQWAQIPFAAGLPGILQAIFGNRIAVRSMKGRSDFWLAGACLLVRSVALQEAGILDEGYGPGYGEDMDLLWRLRNSGWEVTYCNQASIIHQGGSSFGQLSYWRHRLIYHNLFRFMRKWLPPWQEKLLKACWLFGIGLRLIITLNQFKRKNRKIDYGLALRAILQELTANPESALTAL